MSPKKSVFVVFCLFSVVSTENKTSTVDNQNDDSEIARAKTFQEAEKEIIDSINSITRQIMPYVIRNSDSVNLSPQCVSAMMKTFVNLRKLKGWTLEMLDSTGKLAAGMLPGTSYTMGDYDQCLDITVKKGGPSLNASEEVLFTGKYCHLLIQPYASVIFMSKEYKNGRINGSQLGRMKEFIDAVPFVPMMPRYMTHLLGFCVPSVCSEEDLTKLFASLPFPGNLTVSGCEVREQLQTEYHQRIIIGVLGFFFLLVTAGTLTDCLVRYAKRNTPVKHNKGKLLSFAVSFSIYSNSQKFFNFSQESQGFHGNCFRGLVTGSVICIIFSNTYFSPYETFYRQAGNLKNLQQYLSQVHFAAVICLSLAFETLFLSIGFLITCTLTPESRGEQDDTRPNTLKFLFYYYIRSCVPLMFLFGISFLLPLLGSGPLFHDVMDNNLAECKAGWWTYLLMYGNFRSIREQCFPHLWLVPCLMQTAVATCVIAWICSRCFKFGIALLLTAIFGCNFAVGCLTYRNSFPPSYLPYFFGNESDLFWKTSLSTPLSHFSSCGIGILLGLVVRRKPTLKLGPITLLLGWIVSLGILCCVLFLIFPLRVESDTASISTAVYAALHRICYSISVGWIALVCVLGNGGFVHILLSMKALDPLYKSSYFAYIIHFIVITYHIGVAREKFNYSHLDLVLRGFSYTCATYILSYLCHILLEMPIRSIKCSILSTTDQIVLNNFSNCLKQVDILRAIEDQGSEHRFNLSYSPSGSNGTKRH